MNDPMEKRGSTMNMKDPSWIDHGILLREAGTPLYEGSTSNRLTSTLMLLVCCTTFADLTTLWMSCLSCLRRHFIQGQHTTDIILRGEMHIDEVGVVLQLNTCV